MGNGATNTKASSDVGLHGARVSRVLVFLFDRYFETFCGVSPAEFQARNLDSLGADAPIVSHLNGFVKP